MSGAAEFVLIVTILFLFFGIIWTRSTFGNAILKVFFYVMVAWGVYILFGPASFITKMIV